jgi:hypothetical protein
MTAVAAERRMRPITIADFPLSPRELAKWHGWCLELVDALLESHPTGAILYVDGLPFDHRWKFHAALVLDGVVFDAWHPDVRLPPEAYVRRVFGDLATWEINPGGDDEEPEHQ